MSKNKTQPAPATTSKAPSHALYHIEEARSEGGKSFWTEVAVAWTNADGSFNLRARAGAVLLPGESYQLRPIKRDDTQS